MSDSGSDHSVSLATPATVAPPVGSSLRVRNRWTAFRTRVPFVVALVLVAFLLRVVAAVAVEQVSFAAGRDGFLGVDDVAYDRVAWAQAQAWSNVGPGVHPSERYLLNVYTYTAAGLYFTLGHQPLAMKLLNCLFAALAAGLIYLTTRQLFGRLAAYLSGIATAFFPSAFFWSVVHMKDAMFLFLVALLLWLLTRLLMGEHRGLVVPILVACALIGGLRFYVQGLLGVLIPGTIMLQSRAHFRHKWQTTALLLVGCATVFLLSGGARWVANYVPLLNYSRYAVAYGTNSGYVPLPTSVPTAIAGDAGGNQGEASVPPIDTLVPTAIAGDAGGNTTPAQEVDLSKIPTGTSSIPALVAWLPIGLAYALAAPFPWATQRIIEHITIPEMLFWYAALSLAVIGGAVHRRHWPSYIHFLGYIGGMLLLFAIGQGNLGLLIRHRGMMIVPFVFIFSGAGATWLWSCWSLHRVRLTSHPRVAIYSRFVIPKDRKTRR